MVFVFINWVSMHDKIVNPNSGGGHGWPVTPYIVTPLFPCKRNFQKLYVWQTKSKVNYQLQPVKLGLLIFIVFTDLCIYNLISFTDLTIFLTGNMHLLQYEVKVCQNVWCLKSPVLKLTRWHCSTKFSSMKFFYPIRVCWMVQLTDISNTAKIECNLSCT